MALSEYTLMRLDLDTLVILAQRNARPTLQEVVIDPAANAVALQESLTGCQLTIIVGELNDGSAVTGSALQDLISGIANATFSERFFINQAIVNGNVNLDAVGSLNYPVVNSKNIIINLNNGHNLAHIHCYVVAPVVLGDELGNIMGDGAGGGIAI